MWRTRAEGRRTRCWGIVALILEVDVKVFDPQVWLGGRGGVQRDMGARSYHQEPGLEIESPVSYLLDHYFYGSTHTDIAR